MASQNIKFTLEEEKRLYTKKKKKKKTARTHKKSSEQNSKLGHISDIAEYLNH